MSEDPSKPASPRSRRSPSPSNADAPRAAVPRPPAARTSTTPAKITEPDKRRRAPVKPTKKSAIKASGGIDWDRWRERAIEYAKLARMHKPIGALLLLWPTWWALWLAAHDFPPIGSLVIFTLGVWLMRSAGCVINDFADRKLDPLVKRTRDRPLASGTVTTREAITLFFALIATAFVLVLFMNRLTIELSVVGAFLAATYPFTKRYTHLPQVYLGAAFGWSVPMAFAAVGNSLPPICWLLFLANVLWSTIYDTEYAMVDRDDDLKAGAKSTAILFGDADLVIIGVMMVTFIFAMLLVAGRAKLHWPYEAGVGIAAALFIWQQWRMRDRSREHCFAAFRNNNWVGFSIWLGIFLSLALK